jgi:hypothetical protein
MQDVCLTWPENGSGGNQLHVNEVAGQGGVPAYVDGFVDKCFDTNSELEIISAIPTCSNCNYGLAGPTGTITVVVAGGSGTYNFHWSGGEFWTGPDPVPPGYLDPNVENPTGLIAGDYHLTVTDSHFCSVEIDVTVELCPIDPPEVAPLKDSTIVCIDQVVNPATIVYNDQNYLGIPGNIGPDYYPFPPTLVDACGNDLDPDGDPEIIFNNPYPEQIPSGVYPPYNTVFCEGSVVYKYAYTDYFGNTVYWTFTWIIEKSSLEDLLGPHVVKEVPCAGLACCSVAPDVLDDCGLPLEWDSRSDNCSIVPDCDETQVVHEYYYSDCTGATYTWTWTYNIVMPDFELPAPGTSEVGCLSELNPDYPVYFDKNIFLEGVEFKDACDNDMTPAFIGISDPLPACEGDVVYSWLLTDCVGHTQTWTHTVSIVYAGIPNYPDEEAIVTCPVDAQTQPSTTHLVDACGFPLDILSVTHTPCVGYEGGDVVWTFKLADCTYDSY